MKLILKKNLQADTLTFWKRDEIRRMIINIIDNSIKYANVKSMIKVILYKKDDSCILVVEDKGKGISEENLSKIFEPFYRVDKIYWKEKEAMDLDLL